MNMNLGPGKVWQPSSMIQMQVRQYDMPHIPHIVAQSGNLMYSGVPHIKTCATEKREGADCLARPGKVSCAEASFNQYKSIICLDE
jgi:hypothetical protein